MISMSPLAQMISTRTEDGVLLHGALYEPAAPTGVAVFLIHGGWGNFYTGLGRFLPGVLAEAGFACLSLNTRDHDYGTVADREPCIGLMRAQFEDSPKDIAAGLRFLKDRGYHRYVMIAHSYGCPKAVYSQIMQPDPGVLAMILCSAGPVMTEVAEYYIDVPYDEAVRQATELVEAGEGEKFVVFRHFGPVPLLCTARTFLSVWGPDLIYDLRKYMGEVRTPLLVAVCEGDFEVYRDRCQTLYQMAQHAERRDFVLLPGGDHYYLGAEQSLSETILAWLDKLELQ